MKILIIGTGSIGRRHVSNLSHLVDSPEFILVRKSAYEDDYSRSIKANVFASVEEGIKQNPDMAVIATPSSLHLQSLLLLLPAGIPCYIEKPVVMSSNQIDKLESLLASLPYIPTTMVGCNFRYLPSLKKLQKMLNDNVIGTVVRANFQVGQWLPSWRPNQDYRKSYSASAAMGGGVILDLIHEIDMARWMFGEFESIYAIGGKYSDLDIDSEDCVSILLGGKKPPVISIGMDYISRKLIRKCEIVGDQGSLYWNLVEKELIFINDKDESTNLCQDNDFNVHDTYLIAMSTMLDSIKQHSIIEQDIFEGLKSNKLALKIKEAL